MSRGGMFLLVKMGGEVDAVETTRMTVSRQDPLLTVYIASLHLCTDRNTISIYHVYGCLHGHRTSGVGIVLV